MRPRNIDSAGCMFRACCAAAVGATACTLQEDRRMPACCGLDSRTGRGSSTDFAVRRFTSRIHHSRQQVSMRLRAEGPGTFCLRFAWGLSGQPCANAVNSTPQPSDHASQQLSSCSYLVAPQTAEYLCQSNACHVLGSRALGMITSFPVYLYVSMDACAMPRWKLLKARIASTCISIFVLRSMLAVYGTGYAVISPLLLLLSSWRC